MVVDEQGGTEWGAGKGGMMRDVAIALHLNTGISIMTLPPTLGLNPEPLNPNLHAPCPADAILGDVAIAPDLVTGVHDDHTLEKDVAQCSQHLANGGCLAHTRLISVQEVWRWCGGLSVTALQQEVALSAEHLAHGSSLAHARPIRVQEVWRRCGGCMEEIGSLIVG